MYVLPAANNEQFSGKFPIFIRNPILTTLPSKTFEVKSKSMLKSDKEWQLT